MKKVCSKCTVILLCCSDISNESLSQFWISLENEYPFLSLNAIKMLVIFSRTYARKLFQHQLKTRQRHRWDVNAEHRLSETSLQPCLSRTLRRRYNLTLNLINCFEFCVFTKVMRCIKYKTALVHKMITIICCTLAIVCCRSVKNFCAF